MSHVCDSLRVNKTVKYSQPLDIDLSTSTPTNHIKGKRGHVLKTSLSGHNERKAIILLAVWDKYLTCDEVARKTFSDSLGIDYEHHKRNTEKALNKYLHCFKKPYLISKFLKKNKGRIAYKCNWKGKRMACELYYRQQRWLNLNWKHSQRHKRWNGKRYKYSKFNVICRRSCDTCQFNPNPQEQKIKPSIAPTQRDTTHLIGNYTKPIENTPNLIYRGELGL